MRLLAFGFLIHFLRHGMVFPLIPLYAQSLGAMESHIGFVVSSFHLLSLFLAIPMGGLVERFGLRPTLACGLLCNSLYSLFLIMADSLLLLVLAQVVGGMGFLCLIIGTQTYVSSHGTDQDRERGFGLITFAAAVGQTLGPALGGFLVSWAGYGFVFQTALVLALLGGISLAMRPQQETQPGRKGEEGSKLDHIRVLIKDPHLISILGFTFSIMVVVSLRGSFLPVLLQSKGLTEDSIGLLLSCFALAMTLIRLGVGRILGSTTRLRVLVVTLGCVIVGSGVVPMLSAPWLIGLVLAVYGLGFGLSQPLSMVMISDVSSSGLAIGLRFFTITVATFVSPLIMGWVAQAWSLATAFYLGSSFLALAGGLVVVRLVREGRPEANKPSEG